MNWEYVLEKMSRLFISATIIFGAVLGVLLFVFAAFLAAAMFWLFLEAIQVYGIIAGLTVALHGVVFVVPTVFVALEMFAGVRMRNQRRQAKSGGSKES